ncbi:MAG: restriction endonuclease subunit R, partial [Arthrobacter sp.]
MANEIPGGWTLCASSFNWVPDIVAARRTARDIVSGIADSVRTVELEPGLVWRSFPAPQDDEVDALRESLAAKGA